MTKRIYEFAKEHNMSSKAILDIASEQGLDFGSHMSSIDQKDEKKLLQAMKNSNSKSKQNNKKEDNSKQVQSKQTTNQNKASKSGNNKNSEGSNKTQNNSNNRGQKTITNNKPQNNNQRSNNNDNKSESSNRRGGRRRNNRRRGNRRNTNEGKGITQRKHKDLPESFEYSEGMNIQDIAKLFHRDATEIIMKLMGLGIMANQNQA